jgi:glycerophosphoryl diester phosphodiesterase
MIRGLKLVALMAVAVTLIPGAETVAQKSRSTPIVIGHRGASGYRPEHTLEAYELAIDLGADFVEPDLVSTKDGVLVARHENEISGTTDVANRPEFASRKTTKIIDEVSFTGWFTEDFTLAELKTLRAKERLPQFRSTAYDGLYLIPTLQEVIDLVKKKSQETGRKVGIYPETKHPTYHDVIGLSLEEPLVNVLKQNGYTKPSDAIFVQSFETANLKELNQKIDVRLVQLFGGADEKPYDFVVNNDPRTYGSLTSTTELRAISSYADGIGPFKDLIVPTQTLDQDQDGEPDDLNGDGIISAADKMLLLPTSLVKDAHRAGLLVHPYTFRNETFYLATNYKQNPKAEYKLFYSLGVDGLFSDFPDTALETRKKVIGR